VFILLCNPTSIIFIWIIPWSRIIHEKLTVALLVMKFFTFYGSQGFSTAFIRAYHRTLFWVSSILSTSSHTNFLRSLSSSLYLFSQMVSSYQVLLQKFCTIWSPKCMLHVQPISPSLIWSPEQYLIRSTCYEAPHYAVLSTFPLLPVSYISTLFSNTLNNLIKNI